LPAHLDHGLVVAGHLRYERGVDRPLTIGGGVCRLLRAGLTLDEDLDMALGALREAVAADLDGPADLRRGRRSARLHVLALPGRGGVSRSGRREHHRRRRSARHSEQESGAKANSRLATADEHRNSLNTTERTSHTVWGIDASSLPGQFIRWQNSSGTGAHGDPKELDMTQDEIAVQAPHDPCDPRNRARETAGSLSEEQAREIAAEAESVVSEIATVVEGKDEVARIAVLVLLAGGHLLIEDIPGVGK